MAVEVKQTGATSAFVREGATVYFNVTANAAANSTYSIMSSASTSPVATVITDGDKKATEAEWIVNGGSTGTITLTNKVTTAPVTCDVTLDGTDVTDSVKTAANGDKYLVVNNMEGKSLAYEKADGTLAKVTSWTTDSVDTTMGKYVLDITEAVGTDTKTIKLFRVYEVNTSVVATAVGKAYLDDKCTIELASTNNLLKADENAKIWVKNAAGVEANEIKLAASVKNSSMTCQAQPSVGKAGEWEISVRENLAAGAIEAGMVIVDTKVFLLEAATLAADTASARMVLDGATNFKLTTDHKVTVGTTVYSSIEGQGTVDANKTVTSSVAADGIGITLTSKDALSQPTSGDPNATLGYVRVDIANEKTGLDITIYVKIEHKAAT